MAQAASLESTLPSDLAIARTGADWVVIRSAAPPAVSLYYCTLLLVNTEFNKMLIDISKPNFAK